MKLGHNNTAVDTDSQRARQPSSNAFFDETGTPTFDSHRMRDDELLAKCGRYRGGRELKSLCAPKNTL